MKSQRILCATLILLLSSSMLEAKNLTPASNSTRYKKNSMGLGFGIPYGVLGANLDVNIAPNLNLTGGLGSTILGGAAYAVGAKMFLTSPEKSVRPKVSAYYGTNSLIEKMDETKTYAGLSFAVGWQTMWGRRKSNGLDFDVIFIATQGNMRNDVEDMKNQGYIVDDSNNRPIKFSLGYRIAF